MQAVKVYVHLRHLREMFWQFPDQSICKEIFRTVIVFSGHQGQRKLFWEWLGKEERRGEERSVCVWGGSTGK